MSFRSARIAVPLAVTGVGFLTLPTTGFGAPRLVDAFRQSNTAFLGPLFDKRTYHRITLLTAGTGVSAAAAGDVNGDGRPDVIIGMPGFIDGSRAQVGAAFVVLGRPPVGSLELASLASGAFGIYGPEEQVLTGAAVDTAGDFNGDGLGDVLISAPEMGNGRGAVYVVFGNRSPTDVHLDRLGERGLAIDGSFDADPDDGTCDSGCELSGGSALGTDAAPAGDVNGDGLDDIIVAAIGADRAAVVYGRREPGRIGFLPEGAGMRIENLSWPVGVQLDYMPVAGAGDVNRDGLDDVLVGADPTWGGHCGGCRGSAYLIFGKKSPSAIRVDRLGQGGIRITGGKRRQGVGYDVAGPGDVNGDRRPDLLIGTSSSAAVVLAGSKPGNLDIAHLGRRGFLLTHTGVADVDRIGDWNRDGLADFAVGRTVVLGRRARHTLSLKDLASGFAVANQGFCIGTEGEACPPSSPTQVGRLTGAGDVNGDGRDDIILGDATTGPRMRGAAFVILAAGPPLVVINQEGDQVPVSEAGEIELRLLCPANTVRRCAGTLRLTARREPGRVTFLRARFRERAGFHFELSRRIPPWALSRARSRKGLSVKATIRARDARGRLGSTERTLRLHRG